MKILVVGSGLDIIPLFKILNQFDHQYVVVLDFDGRAWGDKSKDFVKSRLEYILNQFSPEVDKIILPPLWEIELIEKLENKILPIFKKYVLYALYYSLVGKIGFVGDLLDKENFQNLFYEKILSEYVFNPIQQKIKKFNKNFPIWIKVVPMWKYYLMQFGARDRMVRKTIKTDLKYFKDADVDTLIPLNWGFLAFDNILRKYLKFKRIRYHSLPKMLQIYKQGLTNKKGYDYEKIKEFFSILERDQTGYNVDIFYTGQIKILEDQKRFLWLLARGKEIDLSFNKIKIEC